MHTLTFKKEEFHRHLTFKKEEFHRHLTFEKRISSNVVVICEIFRFFVKNDKSYLIYHQADNSDSPKSHESSLQAAVLLWRYSEIRHSKKFDLFSRPKAFMKSKGFSSL